MARVPSFAEQVLSSVPPERFRRFAPEPRGAAGSVRELCRRALAEPIDSERIGTLAESARRIAVIISDASRDEPREEMLDALFEVLPRERVTIVVAAGTHTADASVVPAAYSDRPIIVHDGTRLDLCVDVGTTKIGTRVRLLRDVAEADLVVVTGRIRPHYFAGYSGGVKGLFPGCGYAGDILQNHLLKADPSARLGQVDGNCCRCDLEDAALQVPGKLAILNVLSDCDGAPRAAASGHAIAAHRFLVARARELFVIRVPRSPLIVVADRPPVASSLYQASKMLPPAGAALEDGGTVVLVAECDQGTGPRERVNEGIYRLGVSRSLPARHRVILVSSLAPETIRTTYAEYAPDLESALAAAGSRPDLPIPVIWRAGEAIVEVC